MVPGMLPNLELIMALGALSEPGALSHRHDWNLNRAVGTVSGQGLKLMEERLDNGNCEMQHGNGCVRMHSRTTAESTKTNCITQMQAGHAMAMAALMMVA